jgi:general secretion pathway protein D/MSHA biogenesis protein MshL
MNGQPALISVGEDERFIESIESSVDDGVITLSATTSSVVSGLGMAVVATILNDNEVILNLTPVTSELLEEIQYEEIGNIGGKVGLPKVAIRQMTTTVRVRSGEMLVVGGLIDSSNEFSEHKVSGLGNIPGISKLFNRSGNQSVKKEMVILLRPVILN